VSRPGYADTTRTLTVVAGLSQDLALTLREGTGAAPWIVLGSAGALAITGAVMTGLAADRHSALNTLSTSQSGTASEWQQAKRDLETYQTASVVFYTLAGAATVGGIVWLLVAGSEDGSDADASVHVGPTPGGLYGHATWRF
jgi:hypothetical protein